jgi:hypothetical protein
MGLAVVRGPSSRSQVAQAAVKTRCSRFRGRTARGGVWASGRGHTPSWVQPLPGCYQLTYGLRG